MKTKINCPLCGHQKAFEFKTGQIWINDRGYKVKIIDIGFNEVWLLYLDNKHKCGWKHDRFLNQYCLLEEIK